MANNELMGVAPQNLPDTAPGVSLTRPQTIFLNALLDLMKNLGKPGYPTNGNAHCGSWDEKRAKPSTSVRSREVIERLYALGDKAGLSVREVDYIREWVVNRGLHWLSAENVDLGEGMESRLMFRNPAVRAVINGASARGMCVGTVASKEELADYYTQRMRAFNLPQALRDRAAEGLAKVMGYYPKDGSGGGQTVNVQINCTNPYGKSVDAEVTGD